MKVGVAVTQNEPLVLHMLGTNTPTVGNSFTDWLPSHVAGLVFKAQPRDGSRQRIKAHRGQILEPASPLALIIGKIKGQSPTELQNITKI